MKHYSPKLLIAVSIAALTISAANAAKLENADTDGNGEIDITEFRLQAEEKFTAIDTNADGAITEEEKQAARKAQRERRAAERFAQTDTDGDGQISRAEAEAAQQLNDKKRAKMKDSRKAKKDKNKSAERSQKQNRPNPDSDGDGIISKAEYSASIEAKFAQLDQNGDGVISEDERMAHRKGAKRSKR